MHRLRCLTCAIEFDASDMEKHFRAPHATVALAVARAR